MHIKLECPRCKQSLSVPKKKAGGYVQCPRCKGSLWVSENLAESADGDRPDGSMMAESVTAAPPAPPPVAAAAGRTPSIPLPPAAEVSAASAGMPLPPPPPPPSPGGSGAMPVVAIPRPSGVGSGAVTKFRAAAPPSPPAGSAAAAAAAGAPPRKTARFITAEASQSAVKLAADGKLPELHLQEGNQRDKSDAKSNAVSPMLLLAALVVSVGMSMALVLMPSGSEDQVSLARRAVARQDIIDKYFSDLDPKKPLERYQIYLREAQAAYSRGDRASEVDRYRRVLDMLRREHGAFDKGLTGSPSRDKELEEQLTILLGG